MPKDPKKKKRNQRRRVAMGAYKELAAKNFQGAVSDAVYAASPAGQREAMEYSSYWYVVDTAPGYAIVCVGMNKHLKVPFTASEDGEDITLAPQEQWIEVKQAWVPVSS